MHETRFFLQPETQRLGERIDMPRLPAAALHGKARRFVQGQDVVIAVDHAGADHVGIGFGDHGPRGPSGGRVGIGKRGNPHHLSRLEPGRGLDPSAIDAQFALAAHLFDPALAEVRELPAKPSVEALTGVARVHGDRLDAAHARAPRVASMPSASPPTESPTESAT